MSSQQKEGTGLRFQPGDGDVFYINTAAVPHWCRCVQQSAGKAVYGSALVLKPSTQAAMANMEQEAAIIKKQLMDARQQLKRQQQQQLSQQEPSQQQPLQQVAKHSRASIKQQRRQ